MTLKDTLAIDPCRQCEDICIHHRSRSSLTEELKANGCAHYYMSRAFPDLPKFVRSLQLPKGSPVTPDLPPSLASIAGTAFDHRLRMERDSNYCDDVVQGGRELMAMKTESPFSNYLEEGDLEELDRGLENSDLNIRCLYAAVCDTHSRSKRGVDAWNLIKAPRNRDQILADVKALMKTAQDCLPLENPIFGATFWPGSWWFDGGVADLITNSCLIELKAGKLIMATGFVRQALAYALLDVADEYKLDSIGVYLARYGQLWHIPFEAIEKHRGRTITELREAAPWAEGLTTAEHAEMLAQAKG